MSVPRKDEAAAYYFTYIDRVPEADVLAVMERQLGEASQLFSTISEEKSLHRYAPEKWSIRQTLNHISDTERMFAYRALWFGRGPTSVRGPGMWRSLGMCGGRAWRCIGIFRRRPGSAAGWLAGIRLRCTRWLTLLRDISHIIWRFCGSDICRVGRQGGNRREIPAIVHSTQTRPMLEGIFYLLEAAVFLLCAMYAFSNRGKRS